MRIEEGTDSEADSQFLMELMEINEVLNGAQTAGEAEQIGRDVKGKLMRTLGLSSDRAAHHRLFQAEENFNSRYQMLFKGLNLDSYWLSAVGGISLSYHGNNPP